MPRCINCMFFPFYIEKGGQCKQRTVNKINSIVIMIIYCARIASTPWARWINRTCWNWISWVQILIHPPIQLLARKSFLIIPALLTMIQEEENYLQSRGSPKYWPKSEKKKRYSVEHEFNLFLETDNRKIVLWISLFKCTSTLWYP